VAPRLRASLGHRRHVGLVPLAADDRVGVLAAHLSGMPGHPRRGVLRMQAAGDVADQVQVGCDAGRPVQVAGQS
jgi:hypothetical protein